MNEGKYNRQKRLLARYRAGTSTPEENTLVEAWYNQLASGEEQPPGEPDYGLLDTKPRYDRLRYIAGTAALVCISFAAYFLLYKKPVDIVQQQPPIDIGPGTNKATLTLANGKTVDLSSTQGEIIVEEENMRYSGGELIAGSTLDRELVLATPRGGQYQIVLSDSTKVWLNAQSTLKYPLRFSGDRREVEVIGEAYFKVSNNKAQPFIVKSRGQETTVLGTEFNISAYADELAVKTTLASGAIQVASYAGANGQQLLAKSLLAPGEQSIRPGDGSLTKVKVDVNSAIAWKDGKISLNGKTIKQVMAELSRWYDIEVVYEGDIPDGNFFGRANRSSNLSLVLHLLESAMLQYRLEGRKLIVSAQVTEK